MNVTRTLIGAVALSGVSASMIAPAFAVESLIDESAIGGTLSANIAFTSEYYFRGISQSDDHPALQGGFDYSTEIAEPVSLYVGIWGSNVDFNDGTNGATLEADLYAGLEGSIGESGLTWNFGGIYYTYPGAAGSLNYDFFEVQGSLGYDFEFASVTASLNYSPNNFGSSGKAYYPKLAVDVPVGKYVSLGGYVAKQYVENNAAFGSPDYTEWNLSATVNVIGFDTTLAYSDTNIPGNVDGKGKAVILTVARSF